MPRHPPCALNNLSQILKMLASTVQFSTFGRTAPMTTACPPMREVRCGGARPGSSRSWPERTDNRPLRTQQRVWKVSASPTLFHSGKPAVLMIDGAFAPHVNVPPMSVPPPNTRRWRALAPSFLECRCSLERR